MAGGARMLSSQALAEKRKWAIVIAFVVAAVLTPPDPLSQIGLALPTIILYEIGIWTSRMIERSQAKEKLAREKAAGGDEASDKEEAPKETPAES